MIRQTSLLRTASALLVLPLALCAHAQHTSEREAETAALQFISDAYQDEVLDSGVINPIFNDMPLPGVSTWELWFKSSNRAYTVYISDTNGKVWSLHAYSESGDPPGNLLNYIKVPPFVPFYRSETEVFERAREIARLAGSAAHDQVGGASFPPRGSDGTVASRLLWVELEPLVHGYRSVAVNHTRVTLDALTGRLAELANHTLHQYEDPPPAVISPAEALAAARAIVEFEAEPEVLGPEYRTMLVARGPDSFMTAKGEALLMGKRAPVMYVVATPTWEVRLDAGTGEVLRVNKRERTGFAVTTEPAKRQNLKTRIPAGDSDRPGAERGAPDSWAGLACFVAAGSALAVVVHFLTRG
ncbi:MAG: hypothetical protein AB7F50_06545 [Fimbriimonadaceae bacterium]